MKRARGFIILATIATLAFSSVSFGAEPTTKAAATEQAAAKTYADLVATDVLFQNDKSEDLGVYPSFADMDDFNKKIADTVFKHFLGLGVTAQDDFNTNHYKVSYVIKNEGRYATITIDRAYFDGFTNVHDTNLQLVYHFDKETNTEITAEEYTKAMEEAKKPVEVPKEEAKPTKPVFAPLADVVKLLGYTVTFDESGFVMVANEAEGFSTKVSMGVNKYMVDGKEVVLEDAPMLLEDRVYVPTSFFSQVLGATEDTSVEGMITITKGDKKAEVKILTELPTKENVKEEASKEEAIFVPLRKHAEDLGFTLDATKYATDKVIVVTKGDKSVTLTLDKNAYIANGKEMKLDAAPVNKEGALYVPLSFFTELLGAQAKALPDGTMELSVDAPAAPVAPATPVTPAAE